jgi:shikimate kinase
MNFSMKNIVLIGFMGTGKTAAARLLSKRLAMRYISTDELIEEKEKQPIVDIFAQKGEAYFRQVEQAVVKEVSLMKNVVIDSGGGVIIKEENIKNLKKNGIIICLAATADVILARTKGVKHRPLLNVGQPKEKIEELLFARAPYYKKADYTVDTSRLSVEEVVRKIEKILKYPPSHLLGT